MHWQPGSDLPAVVRTTAVIVELSVVVVPVSEAVEEQLRPVAGTSEVLVEPVVPAGWVHSTVHANLTAGRRRVMHCEFAEPLVRAPEQVSAY